MHTLTVTHARTRKQTHAHTHTQPHAHTHRHAHAHTHTHALTHAHTLTHARTHTHTRGRVCCWQFYGKRLPQIWEWQYAAQGGDETFAYPWGQLHPVVAWSDDIARTLATHTHTNT
jgi:hypothetical protein